MTATRIPVDAIVECSDKRVGFVTTVIVDPVQQTLTHLVVQTSKDVDRIVPLDLLERSEDDTVYLRCSAADLEAMPTFTETHYVQADSHDYTPYQSGVYQSPYVTSIEGDYAEVDAEQTPEGEVSVRRGARIAATDGVVGELEELVVDVRSGRITHFVLRKGHLWGQRDVTIPLSAVDHSQDDVIHLKLTKAEIDVLPSMKVKRHYLR